MLDWTKVSVQRHIVHEKEEHERWMEDRGWSWKKDWVYVGSRSRSSSPVLGGKAIYTLNYWFEDPTKAMLFKLTWDGA